MPTETARTLKRAVSLVVTYLKGGSVDFLPLPIDWSGYTPFERKVLRHLRKIPRGKVSSYQFLAAHSGRPKAARYVGNILHRNRLPLILPCHRVVRNDGHLGNYYNGTEVKRKILATEGMDVDGLEDLAERGVRLTGSDTTNIFCNPTCGHARRTKPEHTVEFRSAAEANDAGYRPCKVCRPVAA